MDTKSFTNDKTGQLIPIKVNGQDGFAFVPAPLPPNWEFPANLWPLLAEAKEALGKLDGIGRILPDITLLMTPLRRREALTSSALEGTYATPEELLLFELGATESKRDYGKTNEWREVSNYHKALNQGIALQSEMPLCLRLFKKLHTTLLDGIPALYKNPGNFRDHQVAIGSDRRYVPPPKAHLDRCLDELEKFINSEDTQFDPLVKAYLVHYQFEAIHPFYDGNGRIGRVLLSLMTARWRKEPVPWLYMSAYFERFKDEYISNMFNISANGSWEKWIEFCLRGTIRQANDSINRCDGLRKLEENFERRIGLDCSQRTHQLVKGLFSDPIVVAPQIQRRFGITYPTAKAEIDRLIKLRILEKLDNKRPIAYYSPEIFHTAYYSDAEALS
jgi:Fic family protein